jgi:serine/threonine protein kinase
MGYIAPEILLCQAYGFGCDMYSLGVMLYTLLCGQMPYDHEDE